MSDELSNLGIALRTYIRESTVLITAPYVGSTQNISVGFPVSITSPKNVPPYQNIIVIMTGRGGRGDIGLAQVEERVDFFCYGKSDADCKKVARALIQYFNPLDVRRKTSFTRAECQVNTLVQEAGTNSLTDPDAADWPYTLVTYIVNYCGVPKT